MADRTLTDVELERWLAGALPDDRTRRASDADRTRLEELRTQHAAMLAGSDIAAEVAAIERRVVQVAPQRRRFAGWWWAATSGALAVAAAMLLVITRGPVEPIANHDLHTKGDTVGMVIHVADGTGSHRVITGDTVQRGDRLRFEVSVPTSGYVAVLGVDSSGAPVVYYPAGGRSPAPIDPRDGGILPGAIELDDTPGDERFYMIYAEQPFSVDASLLAAVRDERVVRGASTSKVVLHKKTSRF